MYIGQWAVLNTDRLRWLVVLRKDINHVRGAESRQLKARVGDSGNLIAGGSGPIASTNGGSARCFDHDSDPDSRRSEVISDEELIVTSDQDQGSLVF